MKHGLRHDSRHVHKTYIESFVGKILIPDAYNGKMTLLTPYFSGSLYRL